MATASCRVSASSQLCDEADLAGQVAGVVVDASGDLAAVRKTVLGWRDRECSADKRRAGAGITLLPTQIISIDHELPQPGLVRRYRRALWHLARGGAEAQPRARFCNDLQPGGTCAAWPASPTRRRGRSPPQPEADGTCHTHLIGAGDTCGSLAGVNSITEANIEKWNKGKTWACLGTPPMPPPQEGTQCGLLVPGIKNPSKGVSLADLNLCPLKACCLNWGFCSVFPTHCAIHAPKGGGLRSKQEGY
ncbi:glycoside hydrolase family 18 protein [Akanthomyces lecanii RCEF 1005]|uniref:Glycoside hydrolase family 18 protein n=1 Tax=Akanthomyces lecanii RCEF 1005 TaxID=1081108 RepID=A0A168G0B0_CORDF|nr:glycoside hydrolase family 18 protein [Akanthomyces lecanii RCEF 1005]